MCVCVCAFNHLHFRFGLNKTNIFCIGVKNKRNDSRKNKTYLLYQKMGDYDSMSIKFCGCFSRFLCVLAKKKKITKI